jgi:hypothetical protein
MLSAMLSQRRVARSFWWINGAFATLVAQISCSHQPSSFSRSNLTAHDAGASSALAPTGSLVVEPNPLDLGVLNAGQTAKATLALRNTRDKPLSIASITTSCSCVLVSPAQVRVEPGESVTLSVSFDPQAEPDFRGGLSIEVVGRDSREAVLFRARVNLDIRAQSMAALERHTSPETEGLR